MLKALSHPLNPDEILRSRRALKRELALRVNHRQVRIAILGGSTTHELKLTLELFLLDAGIAPVFYESDFNRFREEVIYEEPKLLAFRPEIVYFHTSCHNLTVRLPVFAPEAGIEAIFSKELDAFRALWEKAHGLFSAVVIQNNFDFPPGRVLGNRDGIERFGRVNFINRLNAAFAAEASRNKWLLIQDINYLSACVGLDRWFSPEYWYRYKLAVAPLATVHLARNLAGLVRGLMLGSRKCLVLDLDNTLWGGVIGDDGLEGIKLGKDNPVGEAFVGFHEYVKALRERGVILAVCSKNDPENARKGFSHPDSVLKLDDFAAFYANWDPKPDNLRLIAHDLNIGLDSLVFVDDNPVERAIVSAQLPMVAVPDVGVEVTAFAEIIDREGFFEPVFLAADDGQRSRYYQANSQRKAEQGAFKNYGDFLASLKMVAEIAPFRPPYIERITQLTNKTNQFNLTTRRYSLPEIELAATAPDKITLYGRLSDRIGDNGLVTVLIGTAMGRRLRIDLWLMSCRVLKRGMEDALFEVLRQECSKRGIHEIEGLYLPTEKNQMVADHYHKLGFEPTRDAGPGAGDRWLFRLSGDSIPPSHQIEIGTYE